MKDFLFVWAVIWVVLAAMLSLLVLLWWGGYAFIAWQPLGPIPWAWLRAMLLVSCVLGLTYTLKETD